MDRILIVDFGSQVTQLIARRVRESGVYCEIAPFNAAEKAFAAMNPSAIILSGGPNSVADIDTPRAPESLLASGLPILGICYGQQTLCAQLGGSVEKSDEQEFGRAMLDIKTASPLFDGVGQAGDSVQVWMSHGDRVSQLPEGFEIIGTSENAPYAAIANEAKKIYAVQFHPEVVHTPDGAKLLQNFTHKIAGCHGDWTMAAFREKAIADIRAQVGEGRVICGLSGGVDS